MGANLWRERTTIGRGERDGSLNFLRRQSVLPGLIRVAEGRLN